MSTIDDHWDLCQKTTDLLNRLAYSGPYELEFIVTKQHVAVLELNPRFWMQHAIFMAQGNGLLKRYFGLDTSADHHQSQKLTPITWIDGFYFTRALLTGRFKVLKHYLHTRFKTQQTVLIWPPVSTSLSTLIMRYIKKSYLFNMAT